jgi:hypothetical protein
MEMKIVDYERLPDNQVKIKTKYPRTSQPVTPRSDIDLPPVKQLDLENLRKQLQVSHPHTTQNRKIVNKKELSATLNIEENIKVKYGV